MVCSEKESMKLAILLLLAGLAQGQTPPKMSHFPLYIEHGTYLAQYGRLTGVPAPDGVGCEVIADTLHCINSRGESAWLTFGQSPLDDIQRMYWSVNEWTTPNGECGQHADGSYTDCCGAMMLNFPLNHKVQP